MRFSISATSLICPKNLRTRLRPVNVCCAIVASHFVALEGRAFRSATAIATGVNFDRSREPKAQFQGVLSPEFVLPTFKTQNDARGALHRTRPSEPFRYGLQKPEIAYLPTACGRKRRRSRRPPCFRAVAPIWDGNRGNSRDKPANPHTFPCTTHSRSPLCTSLACRWPGLPRPSTFSFARSPERGLACPGMELKEAWLTSIPPSRQPSRAEP